jgi:hypothetical protein
VDRCAKPQPHLVAGAIVTEGLITRFDLLTLDPIPTCPTSVSCTQQPQVFTLAKHLRAGNCHDWDEDGPGLDGEGWGNAETGTRSWGRLGPGLTLGSVPAR